MMAGKVEEKVSEGVIETCVVGFGCVLCDFVCVGVRLRVA